MTVYALDRVVRVGRREFEVYKEDYGHVVHYTVECPALLPVSITFSVKPGYDLDTLVEETISQLTALAAEDKWKSLYRINVEVKLPRK